MPLSSDLKRIMVQLLSGVFARWLVGLLMVTWSLSGGAATVIDEGRTCRAIRLGLCAGG